LISKFVTLFYETIQKYILQFKISIASHLIHSFFIINFEKGLKNHITIEGEVSLGNLKLKQPCLSCS